MDGLGQRQHALQQPSDAEIVGIVGAGDGQEVVAVLGPPRPQRRVEQHMPVAGQPLGEEGELLGVDMGERIGPGGQRQLARLHLCQRREAVRVQRPGAAQGVLARLHVVGLKQDRRAAQRLQAQRQRHVEVVVAVDEIDVAAAAKPARHGGQLGKARHLRGVVAADELHRTLQTPPVEHERIARRAGVIALVRRQIAGRAIVVRPKSAVARPLLERGPHRQRQHPRAQGPVGGRLAGEHGMAAAGVPRRMDDNDRPTLESPKRCVQCVQHVCTPQLR